MRCVSINKEIRKQIIEASQGNESVNDTVRRLLVNAEKPKRLNMKKTTISLDEDVLDRLDELKAYDREPYGSVIVRLLNSEK